MLPTFSAAHRNWRQRPSTQVCDRSNFSVKSSTTTLNSEPTDLRGSGPLGPAGRPPCPPPVPGFPPDALSLPTGPDCQSKSMLGKEASLVPPAESPGRTDSTLQGPEGMGVAHLPPTPTIGQEGGSERLEGSEGGLDNKYFPQSTRQGVSSGPVRENCSQRAWLASPRLPAVRTERSNLSGEEVSPCKHPTLVRLGGVRPTPDLVAKTEAATKVSETFNQLMIHLSDNNKILTEGSNRASSVGMATLVPSTPTAFRKSS